MMIDDNIIKKYGLVVGAVYAVILDNPTTTHTEIANYCCISVSSVKRALETLQKHQYIKIKVNKPHPNTYEIINQTATPTPAFGEFGLVRLTEPELKKLQKRYPKIVIDDYIQRIDTYLYNNKSHKINTYATHYATIKLWIDSDLRQNGGYTTHRTTKTLDELKHNEETIEILREIAEIDVTKIEINASLNLPSQSDVAKFYDVSPKSFSLHKNLHDELIAMHRPSKIKVPREICYGDASREYMEELQLKIVPNTPKGSWGMLITDAMYFIEQYRKFYAYLEMLKSRAKNASKEFLDYVGYHEGDE